MCAHSNGTVVLAEMYGNRLRRLNPKWIDDSVRAQYRKLQTPIKQATEEVEVASKCLIEQFGDLADVFEVSLLYGLHIEIRLQDAAQAAWWYKTRSLAKTFVDVALPLASTLLHTQEPDDEFHDCIESPTSPISQIPLGKEFCSILVRSVL